MAAPAAEIYTELLPSVLSADELEQDRLTRIRTARFIGSVTSGQELEIQPITDPYKCTSLFEAVSHAVDGNEIARKNIQINARTAAIEAIYKAGHVTKIKADFNQDGGRVQYGQSMADTNANALRFASTTPALANRVKAETLNNYRIEDLNRAKILDDNWLVVPSFFPDDMSDEEASEAGFFVKSKTGVFQATTVEDGACITESAFVAGITDENSSRHDLVTAQALYAGFGKEVPKTATEFIQKPLLIPKELMPNGVVDVVKLFDELAGTFFGQAEPKQDYVQFLEACHQKEERLEATVEAITNELIAEKDSLHTPEDAAKQLYHLVKKHVIDLATHDSNIDASVFGIVAEYFIDQARFLNNIGEYEQATKAKGEALEYAQVSMCGVGSCGLESVKQGSKEAETALEMGSDSVKDLIKDNERKCPGCNEKTIVYDTKKKKKICINKSCGKTKSY